MKLKELFSCIKNGKLQETSIPTRLINKQDEIGLSPLMVATIFGTDRDVSQLLLLGANKEIEDRCGLTAIDYAAMPTRGMSPTKLRMLS
ncbi:hypothetical protein [Maritalea sp.]|uniref:hypothetical protein n=1 Tax=Maritalea sp. TaxID=2003361 RepID=UPI003EF59D5E